MANRGDEGPTNPGMQPSGAASSNEEPAGSSTTDRQQPGSQSAEHQGLRPGERGSAGMPEQSYGSVPQGTEQESDDPPSPDAEGSAGPAGGQA